MLQPLIVNLGGNGRNADVIANQLCERNGIAERIAELKAAKLPQLVSGQLALRLIGGCH
jgi:hypothetical protein